MKEKELCIIYVWRETCQKQFSMKAGQKCPDFCKDLELREPEGFVDEGSETDTK